MFLEQDPYGIKSLDIKYEGSTRATQYCIDDFLKRLYGSRPITCMTILTCEGYHALMLEFMDKDFIVFIKSGLTSGYSGEGPKGTSTIIRLAENAGIPIRELSISKRLMKKINSSLMTSRDVQNIQERRSENLEYRRLCLDITNDNYIKQIKDTFFANKDIIFIRNENEKTKETEEVDKAFILEELQTMNQKLDAISSNKESPLSIAGNFASLASLIKDVLPQLIS